MGSGQVPPYENLGLHIPRHEIKLQAPDVGTISGIDLGLDGLSNGITRTTIIHAHMDNRPYEHPDSLHIAADTLMPRNMSHQGDP